MSGANNKDIIITNNIGGNKYTHKDTVDDLGMGHMGKVFLAEDGRGNYFAIKELLDESKKDLFVESGKFMQRLGSEGLSYIVKTTYCGNGENNSGDVKSYLVMEALDKNLVTVIDGYSNKGPSKRELGFAFTYTYNLFKALDELHSKGHTHNDLLPTNVLVSKHDLKLTDLSVVTKGMDDNDYAASIRSALQLDEGDPKEVKAAKQRMLKNIPYLSALKDEKPSKNRDTCMAGYIALELLTGKSASKVRRDGINNKDVPEEIEEILESVTKTRPNRRKTPADVVGKLEEVFGDTDINSNNYFVRLSINKKGYEIISTPADRAKIYMDEQYGSIESIDADGLTNIVLSLKTFGNLEGVGPEERTEIEGYLNSFKIKLELTLENQIEVNKNETQEINKEIEQEKDKKEKVIASMDQLLNTNVINDPGVSELVSDMRKLTVTKKKAKETEFQTYLTRKTGQLADLNKKKEEITELIGKLGNYTL